MAKNTNEAMWDKWFSSDTMDRCISNGLMQRDEKEIKKAYKKHDWKIVCRTGRANGTTHFKKVAK